MWLGWPFKNWTSDLYSIPMNLVFGRSVFWLHGIQIPDYVPRLGVSGWLPQCARKWCHEGWRKLCCKNYYNTSQLGSLVSTSAWRPRSLLFKPEHGNEKGRILFFISRVGLDCNFLWQVPFILKSQIWGLYQIALLTFTVVYLELNGTLECEAL